MNNSDQHSVLGAFGALRWMLIFFSLVLAALVPSPGTYQSYGSWVEVFETIAVPALAPIFAVLCLFDVLLCRIVYSSRSRSQQRALRYIAGVEFFTAGVVFAFWLPYFFSF